MRWGIGIAAAAVALSAPAAAGAAELRLGMSFKYLTKVPQVTEPLTASAPSLDIASLNLRWTPCSTAAGRSAAVSSTGTGPTRRCRPLATWACPSR